MIRRLVERLLRDRVLRRRLPPAFDHAPIYCSSAGGLKMLLKPMAKVDPSLLRLAELYVRRGHTVWDIGANMGLFSVAAAAKAGREGNVFAFEADAWLVQQLHRTVRAQPRASAAITVLPVAVGGSTGLRRFAVSRRCRAMNTLADYAGDEQGVEHRNVMSVDASSLLEWLPQPQVIKIDVEGAELEVLRAAVPILEHCRPIVICEVWPGNRAEVSRVLKGAGYSLHDADTPSTGGTTPPALQEASWNTLALPLSTSADPPSIVGLASGCEVTA